MSFESIAFAITKVAAGTASTSLSGAAGGIGLIFASLVMSLARNPILSGSLVQNALLGFALTEAIALFALMFGFLLLYS